MQDTLEATITLSKEQGDKAKKVPHDQEALRELKEADNYSQEATEKAVADLVRHPPAPLSDLRRADSHRVTFVGKNTKRFNEENWKDMAATTKAKTVEKSTAAFFRERVAAVVAGDDDKNNA